MMHSWFNLPSSKVSGERILPYVQFSLDMIAIMISWRVTIHLRIWLNPYFLQSIQISDLSKVAPSVISIISLWIAAALWFRVYRRRADHSLFAALRRVLESDLLASLLAVALTFFQRELGGDSSRSLNLLFIPVSFCFLFISLFFAFVIAWILSRYWPRESRLAVIGEGSLAEAVAQSIRHSPPGAIFWGLIVPHGLSPVFSTGLPVLGTTRQLAEVINRERIDRIIVATDRLTQHEYEYCGSITKRMRVPVSRPLPVAGPDVLVTYGVMYGLHLMEVSPLDYTNWDDRTKRVIDIVGAACLLILLSPFLLGLALVIRLTSTGPILFRSQRVGLGGRHFTFWKFRSMYDDPQARASLAAKNEKSGHIFKIKRDPRVTPAGRFMRRFSLDELPQLFNVLVGDMSLVGPRPLPIHDMEPDGMSHSFRRWAESRATLRPGITGSWQIRGRGDLTFEEMTRYDLEYIENWSLRLDLEILLETPLAVLSGRGAY